jgi:threonine dehydrogenase-like Zn-dependent dehydrogenase
MLKAVVKTARGDGFVKLVDAKEPDVAEGSALVKVGYAGICGSDINILHDRFPSYVVPVIMGHEFSGTIEQVGKGVTGFRAGDRVVCETHAFVCNQCAYCTTGLYNLCPQRKAFGYGVDGAFTTFVNVRQGIIHRIPESISLREAAVLEPLSGVVNALTRNSHISAGESVLIMGPGPMGLLCLQVARLNGGVVSVVGTEKSRPRLVVDSKLGAERTMTDVELSEGL